MTYLAAFTLLTERNIPVVSVNGAIDVNNLCAFKAVVECAQESAAPAIVVVLPSSDYVCAAAYGVLAAAHSKLYAQNRRLLLVCPLQAYPRRIIAHLGLPFSIFDSVARAIAET